MLIQAGLAAVWREAERRGRLPGHHHTSAGTGRRTSAGADMGLLSGLAKAGVAKKLIDEARKPQNQQKAKDLLAQADAHRALSSSLDHDDAT